MLDLDIYSIFIHCIDWVEKKITASTLDVLRFFL